MPPPLHPPRRGPRRELPLPGTPQATDLVLSLTPERVLAAVETAGLRCNTLCYPLNSFENRVYEVELEDRTRRVAKFYRPGRWTAEQIQEEHSFLAELEAEELSVCAVQPFPDGSTLHEIDGIFYSVSERRAGRAPDELSDASVARLGSFVARMHNVGARRQANRPDLDADHYIRRALEWIEEQGSLHGILQARYRTAALAIAEISDQMMAGAQTHRIHADLHLGNILFRDDELRVLDFDDMAHGPAVQDLWLALPGRDEFTRRQREIFLESYERFRPFDRATLQWIEPLRGLRMVRYAGWLARRWHDPAFQKGWPHFGSEDYWRGEVEDLEEQRIAVEDAAAARAEGDPTASAAASSFGLADRPAEEALSNKDYFWDWEEE